MKDELTIRDLYRFLIDNIKIIISTIVAALIIGVVLAVFSNLDSADPNTQDTSLIENPGLISEEKYKEYAEWPIELFSEPQIKQMQAYLLPEAYKITIYVEHENHEPIENTIFMREVFRNNDVVNYIENQLGETLTPTIDFAIHIENLSNSGVYELHFQRGTKEESLELANIVITAINDGVIPVLNNKNVEFINENPELVEEDYTDYSDSNSTDNNFSPSSLFRDLLLYGLVGIIIGGTIGLGISLFGLVFKKKISSLFNYEKEYTDKIVRINRLKLNKNEKINKAKQNIIYPYSMNKLILVDMENQEMYKEVTKDIEKDSNVVIENDFTNVTNDLDIDIIIILTEVNKTRKEWYLNQRTQLSGYDFQVKIIQL
ncbi:hypothetical protein ACEN4K_10550 [Marinilactibacillus psychrotolerans]|uniref:hypothetical protein n=1 Tax=Marinilactibacillus psychrotolerans TaxID=191770 RepID=UPI00388B2CFF